jgi:PST family polysaccharide transporter
MTTIGAVQVLALLVQSLRGKVAAVLLGPPGVGVLGVLDPLVQLVAHVSGLGLPLAALTLLSRAHSRGPAAYAVTYQRFLRWVFLLSGAGTLLALTIALVRPAVFGVSLAPHRLLLRVALLGVPLLALRSLLTSALAAERATGAAATLALKVSLGATGGAAAGFLAGGGLVGFLGGTLVGSAAALGVTLAGIRRRLHREGPSAPATPSVADGPEILATAFFLWVAYSSFPLTHFLSRHLVLSRLGAAEAGVLQAGLDLSGVVALLLGPSTALYLAPAVCRDEEITTKVGAAMAFLRALVPVTVLASLPLLLFPRFAVRTLFSPAFEPASAFLFLLVSAQVLRILAGVFHALLIGLGDVRVYGVLVAAGQLSFGLLAYLWVPRSGARGVALAFLAANALIFILTAARVRHLVGRAQARRAAAPAVA